MILAEDDVVNPDNGCQVWYAELKKTIKTVEDAKEYFKKWWQDGQKDPEMTMRAMARHLSNVLEGLRDQPENWYEGAYYDTKYGCEIYYSDVYGDEEDGE